MQEHTASFLTYIDIKYNNSIKDGTGYMKVICDTLFKIDNAKEAIRLYLNIRSITKEYSWYSVSGDKGES